jgi:hypothetical protein
MVTPRIRPVPDGLTERFWSAAARHRLELQRCADCGRINHPPQALCGHCGSSGLRFAEVDGAGVVYSWTSALRRPGAATTVVAPETDTETILVVALGGDPDALLCAHVDGRPAWVEIGAPVTVTFRELDYTGADGEPHTVTLPDFVPATSTS